MNGNGLVIRNGAKPTWNRERFLLLWLSFMLLSFLVIVMAFGKNEMIEKVLVLFSNVITMAVTYGFARKTTGSGG